MYIKQLSVFIENKSGRLADIADMIGEAGIDIRAISVADNAEYGVLRLIVNKPDKARDLLCHAGITVSLTDVIAVGINDKPGAFAQALRILHDANISVQYMYTFISRRDGQAYVILRVGDNELAHSTLSESGIELISPHEIYDM